MMRHSRAIPALILVLLAGQASAADEVRGEAQLRDAVTVALEGARYRLKGLTTAMDRTCGGSSCDEAAVRIIGPKLKGRVTICVKERRIGHGYHLAECTLDDGTDLALVLIEEGLAVAEANAEPRYLEAVEKAKAARRGLWAGE